MKAFGQFTYGIPPPSSPFVPPVTLEARRYFLR